MRRPLLNGNFQSVSSDRQGFEGITRDDGRERELGSGKWSNQRVLPTGSGVRRQIQSTPVRELELEEDEDSEGDAHSIPQHREELVCTW